MASEIHSVGSKKDPISARHELINNVLTETFREFQTWSATNFEQTLQAIDSTSSATEILEPSEIHSPIPTIQFGEPPTRSKEVIEITDATDGSSSSIPVITKRLSPTFELGDMLRPHPPYDSTTPVYRSIYHGDDPSSMPFAPFSDEPTFTIRKLVQLTEFCYGLSWQKLEDPSVQAIVLEAVCRLMERHNLSIDEIEESDIMPCSLDGVMEWYRAGDFPGCFSQLSKRFEPKQYTNSESINNLANYFCHNPSCNILVCSPHDRGVPCPQRAIPKYKCRQFFEDDLRPYEPCDEGCYLFLKKNKIQDLTAPEWSEDDRKLFEMIMKSDPDALPCDVSTIIGKPCHEVFAQRAVMFPDPPPGNSPQLRTHKTRRGGRAPPAELANAREELTLANGQWESKTLPKEAELEFITVATQFNAPEPCSHLGPCDQSTDCYCWKNGLRCEKWCWCSPSCIRKHKGCNCSVFMPARMCGTDECECYAERRECDYELCKKCGAGLESSACCNISVQRSKRKRVDVRATAYGLGLFILQRANVGDLVTEYTGEIVNDPTVESRSELAKHTGRNYVMQLSRSTLIDGGPAGGEARYINHSSTHANVRAEIFYVNGEHRIALFATQTIQAQQELLLNYGEDFFEEQMPSGSQALKRHRDSDEWHRMQVDGDEDAGMSGRRESLGIINADATASPEQLRISTKVTRRKKTARKRAD